ncbi:hypothetical protein CCS01_21015 [Rhodopila globiformis]|uniref:Uncharacterized protein n=2 Tax=Rhodopila globiformis TaxID=1071 RepID=A0A2S6N4X6_RHOGL|nr:hypothetical protein CCS01_21015 [Rhodopila globiformis]
MQGRMHCKQCGGPMMPETVIKLRRGLIGFRETRFPGAYCAWCRIGVTIGGDCAAGHRQVSVMADLGRSIRQLLASWSGAGASRSTGGRWGAKPSGGLVPWRGRSRGRPFWVPPRQHPATLEPPRAGAAGGFHPT